MSNDFEDFINNNREAFESREPGPAVLDRIHEQMRGKNKKKAIVISMQMVRWAAACFILLAGAGIFWVMQKTPGAATGETAVVTKPAQNASPDTSAAKQPVLPEPAIEKKDPVVAYHSQEAHERIAKAAEAELDNEKQALFAKLNNMGSASQRITAASEAHALKNTDKEIVDALVKTMNTDPNTNVRLAALEALSKFHRESYVKKQLVASLQKQTHPRVQIELIELLTRMKQTTILKELDKMVKDGNTMEAVKDHAYSSIFTLRS
jgi:hypothetical protein